MPRLNLLVCLLILALAATGCSNSPVTPPPGDDTSVHVDLDPTAANFSVQLDAVDTPDGLVRGPFLLRGQNLHYADGALVVDLTITNSSPASFAMPVTITFFRILPEGTIILNSPDDGPTFTFDFANDDLAWTPGEESLPLTVMFLAEPGVSVAFNAHIGVGGVHNEGRISGRVWLDENRNGLQDADERGIGGVPVALDDGGPQENLHLAVTDTSGYYVFRGLEAGAYEVRVHRVPPRLVSTTPSALHVLLAPSGDGAGVFEGADFGFAFPVNTLPGPRLVVTGNAMDPLVAYRGETVMYLPLLDQRTLRFAWDASADPGLEIKAYRWGWDLIDPDDPEDPGWSGPAGLGAENKSAVWEWNVTSSAVHQLVIHCWDSEDHLTRARISFELPTR
jgi:hypothetical protein